MTKDIATDLNELDHAEAWSVKDARAKFTELLEASLEQPQVIAPQRGNNADERFVCVPLAKFQAITKELSELKTELRKKKVAQILDEVRQLYADTDEGLVITRTPPKAPLDFGYGKGKGGK